MVVNFLLECSFLSSTYIIVAPKVFRPGMDMVLRVSILKSTSPVDVKASIRNEITKLEVATARGTYEAGWLPYLAVCF